MNILRGIFGAGVMPLLLVASGSALAFDLAWSGFGTVGYAQSDQPVNYQRFIDEKGSFKRDSVLGAQVDARFSQQWGATVQVKAAPSDHSDSQWQASLAWAFVSWRPSDDWLIRAGKLRLPFMLNTENADVGGNVEDGQEAQHVGLGVAAAFLKHLGQPRPEQLPPGVDQRDDDQHDQHPAAEDGFPQRVTLHRSADPPLHVSARLNRHHL